MPISTIIGKALQPRNLDNEHEHEDHEHPNKWTAGRGLYRVLCMQGGDDDGSYAKNSEAPASAITLCKPHLLTAIQSMKLFFRSSFHEQYQENDQNHEVSVMDSIRIADLGCATGYNTLATIGIVVETLRERYKSEFGFEPEFEAFFSDLPSNDFNSLFQSLTSRRKYYAAGVPGSFYGRLFPKGKLLVAVSLSALHWLSQIPEEVLDKRSKAWNKGRAWIDGAEKETVEAYAKQSEEDLDNFLSCRKQEIVKGGLLFLLMGARSGGPHDQPDNQLGDPASRAKHPFTASMDRAWQDLLDEGLINEETRDGFNIPAYMRSKEEVEKAIKRSQGFEIKRIEYKKIMEHSKERHEEWIRDPNSYGKTKANLVRATLRPIVDAHIGPFLSQELFNRFEKRVSSDISLLHETCFYGVLVVSAVRV